MKVMKAVEKVDKIIDVTGRMCPVPIVKTALALRKINKGQILAVITDYPTSLKTVPKGVEKKGHKVVSINKLEGYSKDTYKILIMKCK